MGEHRKQTQKRLKEAEAVIKVWHSKVKSDINEMLDDLLREMLDRHHRLASKYLDGGRYRDTSISGLYSLEKELLAVNKQISKPSVDRATLSKKVLHIAAGLGDIRKSFASIQESLSEARGSEPRPEDLVSDILASFDKVRPEWVQLTERFEDVYGELENTPHPMRLRGCMEAFAEARMDLFMARVEGDGSDETIAQWAAHLNEVLGRTPPNDEVE